MSLESLPPLREVVAKHNLLAKRSLGQSFIFDLNLTAKIARSCGNLAACDVLEIGPGPGSLTRSLLLAGARHVLAVEKDSRFLPALEEVAVASEGRLAIRHADATKYEPFGELSPPVVIASNLPFNVSTVLLSKWLLSNSWPPFWQSMTLMFQREVAERILSPPGNRTYGRLSVLAQFRTIPRLVMHVPAKAFAPRPKVSSSVIRFVPIDSNSQIEPEHLMKVSAAAFGQRRKMLRSSLARFGPSAEIALRRIGVDPCCRAEDLSVADYCLLARQFYSDPHSGK
ncbi:MAG: 16S rRNA (adenine(1518)-N(6)/adenine(1519)-N(6))-dimethyltransferase RsmA [Albidovulum sp.]|nr:16S rRNA (adenine(1518)-N(6)/adenine(1519)-N(6))-dimethyltransferase RsmA [Albidovulum sp.]MDE0531267.1 16S rRNA (adenine(1518)-N(6)/adenine(1519)-N(6))-dimethyltransferase RsmA [Albidovulum sp.]